MGLSRRVGRAHLRPAPRAPQLEDAAPRSRRCSTPSSPHWGQRSRVARQAAPCRADPDPRCRVVGQLVLEEAAQAGPPAQQAHRHGVGADARPAGDLEGHEPVDVPRDEGVAGLVGQQRQRPVEEGHQLVALEQVDQRVRGRPRPPSPDRRAGSFVAQPAGHPGPVLAAHVAGDRVQPRGRARRVDQPLAQPPGQRERLLRQVLGGDGVAGQGRAEPDDPPAVVGGGPGSSGASRRSVESSCPRHLIVRQGRGPTHLVRLLARPERQEVHHRRPRSLRRRGR